MNDADKNVPAVKIDEAKRETLRKLGNAAWAAPVVATFAIGGLSMSSAWAQPNGIVTHS